MQRDWRRALWWIATGLIVPPLVLWIALGYVVARIVVMPKHNDLSGVTHAAGRPVEPVWLTARDGTLLSAWMVRGGSDRAVVFANGIYGDRRGGIGRAAWYLDRGYSVLLLDLRGTGQSASRPVTMGWDERLDLMAAHDYLHAHGYRHVGAHGISLGAATAVYSCLEQPQWSWVVLESPYSTLDLAWRNRLAMVGVPHFVTWPVRWWTASMIGARVDQLSPLRHIARCTAPTMLFAGDDEAEIPLWETEAVFDAAAAALKRLEVIEGGQHNHNFMSRFPDQYLPALDAFMTAVEAQWSPA